jgi:hypothetical protein
LAPQHCHFVTNLVVVKQEKDAKASAKRNLSAKFPVGKMLAQGSASYPCPIN